MSDFQYTDILILALIAAFIALRLRNTLGKDIGHKPDLTQLRRQLSETPEEAAAKIHPLSEEKTQNDQQEAAAREAIGDPALLAGVDAIAKADPSFSLSGFTEGAKGAFEWVLKAYNAGDTETLKTLLSPPIFEEFSAALEASKASTEKTETTLVAITHAEVAAASLEKAKARITLRIVSEQIEVIRNAEGKIIGGDPSRPAVVEDEWVFERDVKSRNPNWVIMDT
jgi:predicted lipid-binding transport protein (Tim44 family)